MALINLDFNLEDVKSNFEPLPTGEYEGRIIGQELKKSRSNNNMLVFTWDIVSGEYAGRKFRDYVVLTLDWKVKQYAELIGVESGSQIDPEMFVGAEGILHINCREQTEQEKADSIAGGYDPDALKNEIKKVTKIG